MDKERRIAEMQIVKQALDASLGDALRLNSLDYLRVSGDPKWIRAFLLSAANPDNSQDLRDYARYCALQHSGRPLLEMVDKLLGKARAYMSRVNRGEEKFDSKKMRRANEASNVFQQIMSSINNGCLNRDGEIQRIRIAHNIRPRGRNGAGIMLLKKG